MARFRLSSHNDLRVETGRYNHTPWARRICDFCDADHVQDEQHIILEYEGAYHLRENYPELVEQASGDLHKLMGLNPNQVSRFVSRYIDQIDDLTCETDKDFFFDGNQSDQDGEQLI